MNQRLKELEGLIDNISKRLSEIKKDTDFNNPERVAAVNGMIDRLETYTDELEAMLLSL